MNFVEKRIKIQTLQMIATESNKLEDIMIDQGKDPIEARKEIVFSKTQGGRTCEIKQIPYLDDENINGVGKGTSQGFVNTHKVNTSYKDFTSKTQQQFSDVKEMRNSTKLKEEYLKKDQQVNDENKQRINFYTKDHVSLMFEGIKNENKNTVYRENHSHNEEKQKVTVNADMRFHARKNDINVFTDAFVKHKGTMRK